MIKLTENDYPEHVLDEMMLVNNSLHVTSLKRTPLQSGHLSIAVNSILRTPL